MKMQTCMWCSKDWDSAESKEGPTLCGCCLEHFSLPPDGPIPQHLDGLPFPVLGVELHAGKYMITRAVNRSACAWLNKEPVEIIQHLTGNVIECVHAPLPDGCGGSLPCRSCEVLRMVVETVRTGEPLIAPAMLQRVDARRPIAMLFRLTTLKAGGLVMLRMDRL